MSVTSKALLWAAIIISAALIMAGLDIGDGASLGVIGGLTGAAWGSLASEGACSRSCIQ